MTWPIDAASETDDPEMPPKIMLASTQGETALARLADVPLCEGGANREQVENVLAAVAAAWALGIPTDIMRTGIETFVPGQDGDR